MDLKEVFEKKLSPWAINWNIGLLPTSFIIWWYSEYMPFLWAELNRIVEIFANKLSLGLVVKNFFKPWKNSNTAAGWIAGLMFKTLYLIVIGPMWIVARLLTIVIWFLMFSFWLLLFVILIILVLHH